MLNAVGRIGSFGVFRLGGSSTPGGGTGGGNGPLDEAPVFGAMVWEPGMLAGSVPEVTTVGTPLAQALAIPGTTFTYSLIYDPDAKFAINSTGVLSLAAPLDYASDPVHQFTISATTDAGAVLINGEVTVQDRATTNIDIAWDAAFPGGFVPDSTVADGSVKVADISAYPGANITLSITDNDSKLALVDNGDGTGELYLDGALDATTANNHPFTITATNGSFPAFSVDDYLIPANPSGLSGIEWFPMGFQVASPAGTTVAKLGLLFGGSSAPTVTFTLASFERSAITAGTNAGTYS